MFLVNFYEKQNLRMGSSGAAIWGIDLICAQEMSARKQKARGDVDVCNFEKDFLSVLASLGLNFYCRDRGGEGCETARRRNAPPGSFFLRITRTERCF